jgi:hypothetical protein
MKKFLLDSGLNAPFLKSAIDNPNDMHCLDSSYEANTWTQLPNEPHMGIDRTDPQYADIREREHYNILKLAEYAKIMEDREIPFTVLTSRYDLGPDDLNVTSGRSLLMEYSWPQDGGRETHKIIPENAKFVSWKNRWLYGAVMDFGQALHRSAVGIHQGYQQLPGPWVQSNLKLFTCMMHIPKPHRCAIMDYLFKKNVMDHGQVRFCNNEDKWRFLWSRLSNNMASPEFHPNPGGFMNNLIMHAPNIFSPFKYWGDINPSSDVNITWSSDPSYDTGVVALEAETMTDLKFITQKSYMPTLWRKPFCILGNSNANNEMKKMGYELFDELFDYSGETADITTLNTHSDADIANGTTQFEKYQSHYGKLLEPLWSVPRNKASYKALMKDLKEKTEHNLNRTVELVFDDDIIPEEVSKYAYDSKNARHIRQSREIILTEPYFKHYIPVDRHNYDHDSYPFK